MKIVHIKGTEQEAKKQKRVPMYKDPVFMANLRADIIADHNRKIALKRAVNK